jgi:polysaccharide biosynthesis protein VpsM
LPGGCGISERVRLTGRSLRGLHHINILKTLCFIAFQIFFVLLQYSNGFSEEGLKWGRLRFSPELSLSETYTDNIYQDSTDERDDSITTLSPKLSIDLAFAPRNYLTLRLEGDFRLYSHSDNFKKEIYRTSLFWTLTTQKGSTFKVGARADFNSIQPYSERDDHKDYEDKEAYADVLFPLGAFTEVGIRYSHLSERFKDPLFALDECDRDSVTLKVAYKKLPATALLIEYTFYHQDNNDIMGSSTDFNTHILLIGAQWEPTAKLSGFLKAGYYASEFENDEDSSGLAIDADVIYRFSDVTHFKVNAFRRLATSTRAARDTGDFYVSTGGSMSVSYRRWDPLTVSMDLTYRNNKYEQKDILGEDRKDDLFGIGMRAKYSPRNWLSFVLTYHYEVNDTNFDPADYRENRVQASITFAL